MAKQTFTTGQVLLASQLTSLQQTALGGGAASAKVASYTLVAADAGTAISMTNASATTITVNTGLFAAGDTVQIHNLGAGVCTVTAGTATVSTSGSLALSQNQGGVLYFSSSSAAIFFQYATPASGDIEGVTAGTGISGGGTSGTVTITNSMATAIDAKGDLVVGTGADAFSRLAVGASNGMVLTVDSAEATGLKYATASSGALTKIISQQITNSAGYNLDDIFSATYTNYFITITDCSGSGSADLRIQFRYGSNTQVNTMYKYGSLSWGSATTVTGAENSLTFIRASDNINDTNMTMYISRAGNASVKPFFQLNEIDFQTIIVTANWGYVNENQTYTGLRFTASSGNVTALVTVYGYQE